MIRRLLPTDFDEVYNLGNYLDVNFKNKNNLEELITNDVYQINVALNKGKIVGFIMLTTLYETMELLYLVVDEKARGLGYGTALVNYAIDNKNNGVNRMILEVRNNNNPAIGLYQKLGFKEINRRYNYYGDNIDAIIMERSI